MFRKIFNHIDNINEIDEIKNFCEELAYEKSIYVKEDFQYIEHQYDPIIYEALKELYIE